MKPLIFHPSAEMEVQEAAEYYEQRRTGLGAALRLELEAAVRLIAGNPARSPRFEATNYRNQPLRRFPYVVFFEDLDD